MRFEDIPGNNDLKTTFQTLISKNKLPHCILLTGEQGGGVFALGLAIASALLCSENHGQACGKCKQCEKYLRKFTHPDLHFTFPIIYEKNKKETSNAYRQAWNEFILQSPFITEYNWLEFLTDAKKQGRIPVSEINAIIDFAKIFSYEDGPKVLLIWNADVLGKEGNRLLKLIEDPPDGMFIVLIAESEENLLNTIVSRAQHYHFAPPSTDEIQSYLEQNYPDKSHEDIENAALLSDGNVALAFEFLNNKVTKQMEMILPWLRDCYSAKAASLYKWASQYNGFTKEEQKMFWLNFLRYLQEMQRIYVGSNMRPRLTTVQVTAARKMSSIISLASIDEIYDIINQAIYAIERNAKADLAFLSASFRIHNAFKLN